jgi:hypothetical protein
MEKRMGWAFQLIVRSSVLFLKIAGTLLIPKSGGLR